MSKKIKIGIVGTGSMANMQAENFAKIADVELTSCHDVVADRAAAFAQKHGFKHVAKSVDELVEQVDAVSVVTPDRFHAEASIAVLRAKKHLLCEKPLTVTLDEARKVAAAAEKAARHGVIHMVDFSYRYSGAYLKAIELVAAGKLGELRHVRSFYLQSWLTSDMWGHWENERWLWRLQSNGGSGGVLADIGCHILEMTTAVAGEVARIRCDLRTFPKITREGKAVTELRGQKLDANDTAVIELEFAHGGIGLVQTTRWATGEKNHLRLAAHGTDGALRFDLDDDPHRLDLCLGTDKDTATWRSEKVAAPPSVFQRFIHAVRTGEPDQPDVLRGAQVQAYLDACARSAKSGKWESVQAWK
jgi:predicted dehydrogenase